MPHRTRPGSLTIGALSRATGIHVGTLRTWERRYEFPASVRKPSGHRLYSVDEIPRLLRVKDALVLGHQPAQVLKLSSREIESLLALPSAITPIPITPPTLTAAPSAPTGPTAEPRRPATTAADPVTDLMRSVLSFDRAGLDRGLRAEWASLGPIRFLEDCAGPFIDGFGRGWRAGTLQVRHEHFATALLADLLRELRRPYDDRATGPGVAMATFPGDRHEIGLLMASLICAVRGWRVLYVGVDTPIDQIAALAREVPLSAVALSVSPTVPRSYAIALALDLRGELPEGIAIWLGGRGAPGSSPGVVQFAGAGDLDRHLAAIAAGRDATAATSAGSSSA